MPYASSVPPPARVVIVPGLDGSGPNHWQTIWEHTRDDVFRVELGQWARPHRNSWITRLEQAIHHARGPVVLAAHSLGCIAVAWWATFAGRLPGSKVAGALLVAPADVDHPGASNRITSFAPVPLRRLPFPSLLVASSNDPWITLERARELAARWGSGLIDAGALGHINADSDLGSWREGQALLARLLDLAGLPVPAPPSPTSGTARQTDHYRPLPDRQV